jgi:biopolymer transport protein ExbB/TolQ
VKLPTLVLLVLLLVVTLFTALNWTAFTTPTQLSLIVTTVQAPLGVLMLILTGAIVAAFLVFLVFLQTTTALEARRLAKELKTQRELADRAEASRFTELHDFLAQELAALRTLNRDSDAELASRMDAAERALRTDIEHAGNTLAAYIGELEHRLESPGGADRVAGERR